MPLVVSELEELLPVVPALPALSPPPAPAPPEPVPVIDPAGSELVLERVSFFCFLVVVEVEVSPDPPWVLSVEVLLVLLS
ncbi:MAG TPA: hypothetical protein VLT82_02400 [Myxococcaceae bacterium]|nr:hypothetical protein [Myxococcaceae bacterium]